MEKFNQSPDEAKLDAAAALNEIHRLQAANRNLRATINSDFFKGNNRKVTLKYSEAIVVHTTIIKEASLVEDEIIYKTNAKKLGAKFGIGRKKAGRIIRTLVKMSAWRKLKTTRKKITTYSLGTQTRNDGGYTVRRMHLRLKNPRVRRFYENEKNSI